MVSGPPEMARWSPFRRASRSRLPHVIRRIEHILDSFLEALTETAVMAVNLWSNRYAFTELYHHMPATMNPSFVGRVLFEPFNCFSQALGRRIRSDIVGWIG